MTKSAGHTPGPWTAFEYGSPRNSYYVRAVNGEIVISGPSLNNKRASKADAVLIAAAPDLLAALRCFIEDERFHVGIGGNPIVVDKMIAAARAAIAKATGDAS